MFMDGLFSNWDFEEDKEQEGEKDGKKNQNENEFQKLVSYINDPLLKIDHVIQSIKDFYKNDKKVWKDRKDPNESKEKRESQIFTAYCNENDEQDSAEIEIKVIISRKKKANPPKKEEKKDNGHENKADTSDGKKPKPSENDQNLMENFNKNVKLLKGVYNYIQPLIMCDESITEIRKNEKKEMSAEFKKLYFIVRTTRNCLCHLHCFFNETLTRKMHSNITNLYDILGVDLKEKHRQKEIYNDNKTYDKFYYYGKGGVMYPNDSKPLIEVSRDTINRTIKSLIMRGHSEGEVKDSDSKSIILFGNLLHHLVGTRDTNWKKITGYFDGYEFESLKDGGNGDSSADPAAGQNGETKNNLNITLKRRNKNDFFFEAIKLKLHWAQMLLRDEGAGGSNIAEIHRALAADIISTPSGDLHLEIPSEKKEQLNKIINSIESIDQSASADKVDSDGIDDFFKALIDCKKIVYISSAAATILSNNSPLPPEYLAELKQLNERLTANFIADSNRLIICPLKIQNQWFLIVADRAANFRSLFDCLGNYSVSAPEVQKLCDNFVSDLKKLPSIKDSQNIDQREIKNADATIVSNNSQLHPDYQDEFEQRNERLTANFTADSNRSSADATILNRLIICPLKVQNQWLLIVADRETYLCSLFDCLGNGSVSANKVSYVQNLCDTFMSNLKELPSPKDPKDENQPQNIVEDCGSLICSLAFNLVYCPLHLYPKDVRRIKWQ